MLQPDGTFKCIEVPGPPSFVSWYASWRVFENVLLMLSITDPVRLVSLPVVSQSALDDYRDAFRDIVMSCPEAWHLCVQAESRMRAEHFPRIKRRREREHLAGQAGDYKPATPWEDVFRQAASDKAYWDRHVRVPASIFLTT